MNAAFEQEVIGHVLKQVAFNIQYAAQVRHFCEGIRRYGRLAQNISRFCQCYVWQIGNVIRVAFNNAVFTEQHITLRSREDKIERAGLG